MKKRAQKRQHRPPEPTDITLKPSTYQPTKAEKEEKQDMLGWSLEKLRWAFFKPFRVKEEEE